jgi:hypothetical protein
MANRRTIKYVPKHTVANTNYRELNTEDQFFVMNEMIRWLAIMSELDQSRDHDDRWVREQWWHKRSDTLPKGRQGQNTPSSFIGGLVRNTVYGTQRDLTEKQMDALQNISHIMSEAYEDCTAMIFQIGFTQV